MLVHFSISRISDFRPDSYFESNLEQNRTIRTIFKWTEVKFGHVIMNFEEKLIQPKFRPQFWIFETSPSRENELLQTLFWTKKGPPRDSNE